MSDEEMADGNDHKRIKIDDEAIGGNAEESQLSHSNEIPNGNDFDMEEEESEEWDESEDMKVPLQRTRMRLFDNGETRDDSKTLEELYNKFMSKKFFDKEKAPKRYVKNLCSVYEKKLKKQKRKERERDLHKRSKEAAEKSYYMKYQIACLRVYATELTKHLGLNVDFEKLWNESPANPQNQNHRLMPGENSTDSSTSGVGSSVSDTISLIMNAASSAYRTGASSSASSSSAGGHSQDRPGPSNQPPLPRLSPPTTTPGPWASMAPVQLSAPTCSPSKMNLFQMGQSAMPNFQFANPQLDQPRTLPPGPWSSSAPKGLGEPSVHSQFYPTPSSSDSD